MKVAVIGCGPAGMAATHAAVGTGAEVEVFAPKKMTALAGPVMLHRPIPGINTEQPDGYVRQLVIGGSILDYRLKLYGDVNIAINGDILEHGFHTWPLIEAYAKMWNRYEELIRDRMLFPYDLSALARKYDLVINTAPLRRLCMQPTKHVFRSARVALINQASYPNQPPNTVIYNAREDPAWVRSSRIFDSATTEWRPADAPEGAFTIRKPLSTTCDCHPKVLRTGRFGKWHNETWIDHAYYETRTAVISMLSHDEWESVK